MENKKEQIIQAALKRFAHYGFHKTTMNEVAADLKITKANLYYYYPDKDGLIRDVLAFVTEEILNLQYQVVAQYDGQLLDVLCKLLEVKAEYLKDYYVLHINETLEWIKGQEGVGAMLEEYHAKNVEVIASLFERAQVQGEIAVPSVNDAARFYTELMEGLSLTRSVSDMISGLPNSCHVDEILCSQKKATKFIFNNKIIQKN